MTVAEDGKIRFVPDSSFITLNSSEGRPWVVNVIGTCCGPAHDKKVWTHDTSELKENPGDLHAFLTQQFQVALRDHDTTGCLGLPQITVVVNDVRFYLVAPEKEVATPSEIR